MDQPVEETYRQHLVFGIEIQASYLVGAFCLSHCLLGLGVVPLYQPLVFSSREEVLLAHGGTPDRAIRMAACNHLSLLYPFAVVQQQNVAPLRSDQQLLFAALAQRHHHIRRAVRFRQIYFTLFDESIVPEYDSARLITTDEGVAIHSLG